MNGGDGIKDGTHAGPSLPELQPTSHAAMQNNILLTFAKKIRLECEGFATFCQASAS